MMEKENYKREKYKVFGPILMKIEPEKGIDYWTFGGADEFFDEISLRLINKEITSEEMAEEIRLAVLKDPEMFRVEPDKTEELDEMYKDFGPIQIKIDRSYSNLLRLDEWEFNATNPLFLELADKYLKEEFTKEQFIKTLTSKIVENPELFRDSSIDSEIPEDDFNDYKAYGPIAMRIEEGVNPLYWEFDEMNPVFLEMAVKAYRGEIPEEKFFEEIQDKIAEDPEAFRKKSEWEMETGITEKYYLLNEKEKNEFLINVRKNSEKDIFRTKFIQELDNKVANGEMTIKEIGEIIIDKLRNEGQDSFFID